MDSSGIGVLLNRYKQMAAAEDCYLLRSRPSGRILEMGGLVRLIRGFKDRESALEIYKQRMKGGRTEGTDQTERTCKTGI